MMSIRALQMKREAGLTQAKILDFSVKGSLANSQHLGCLFPIPLRKLEGLGDVVALDFFQRMTDQII